MSLPRESSQMPVAYPPHLATTEGSQGNQVPSKAIDKSIDSSSHAQTCCKMGCRLESSSPTNGWMIPLRSRSNMRKLR
jgi:hypothetical protein